MSLQILKEKSRMENFFQSLNVVSKFTQLVRSTVVRHMTISGYPYDTHNVSLWETIQIFSVVIDHR